MVDPCTIDNGGCDALVDCTSVAGIVRCGTCPDGFDDVLRDGTRCRDVDECAKENGGCDPRQLVCRNTLGGRECACKPGLHETAPRQCSRNVGCIDPSACSDQADCQTLDGQRLCQCRSGYEGNGGTCADIDECQRGLANCGPRSRCTNRPGGFDCVCLPGYEGPGCTDIDECRTGRDNCDDEPDACVNTQGGFWCKCPAGYAGSGSSDTCIDIDECRLGTGNCDANPDACVNDPGGFHCSCPAGYRGLGVGASGCGDIDECAERTDNCDRDPGACVNVAGDFRCVCPGGYAGNGVGEQGCTDVDECARGSDNCDDAPNACVNMTPGFHCQCPSGYQGDGVGSEGCKVIDPCATNPCGAAGSCAADGASYRCDCSCGYAASGTPESCVQAKTANVGYAALYAQAVGITAGTIYAVRIGGVPAGAKLLRFGVLAGGSGNPNVRMALYEDTNAAPGKLLAQSSAAALSAGTFAVASGCPALSNAAYYWLAFLADGELPLSIDSRSSISTVVQSAAFAGGFPMTLGGTPASGPLPSLYAVVQLGS